MAAQAWRIGFEIELLAPKGRSRFDLASSVARGRGGTVRRFFHTQDEGSLTPGVPHFESLTLGFEALDAKGAPIASFVDDVTLQAGLDRGAPAAIGWYRLLTDDGRLLRLLARHCDPNESLETVLSPIATLFGAHAVRDPSGMIKVSDDRGISVAIAAPTPGQRERACEIVTPPLEADWDVALARLLDEARAAHFVLPLEGATHIHFDAGALTSASVVANLVNVFSRHGEAIKDKVGRNPYCVRLGAWPEQLIRLVASPGFSNLDWPTARKALLAVGLRKYCDFNLLNLVAANPAKHTFEVRVLPASLDLGSIRQAVGLFTALLNWCIEQPHEIRVVPNSLDAFDLP